jgi:TfoX/Sxy family transcriptional regulator of competence genes
MLNNKKIISDKSALFALTEATEHYVKVSPETEEYLKVWVKEPTWLEAEKALNSVMKIDQRTQSFDIDLQAMYRYMVENFIEKTEPSLSTLDMLRLSPYVGNQLKEILPNPMSMMQEDEEKKDD